MSCPQRLLDCADQVGGAVGGAIGDSAVQSFAAAMSEAAQWVIRTTVGWWLYVPSIDLENSPAAKVRGAVLALSVVVAVAGVMWGGLRMAFRRKGEAAWDVGSGLLRLAAVSALAFVAPQLLLNFGDSFSVWVLESSVTGDVAERFVMLASMGGIASPGVVIFAGIVILFAGGIQAVLMFLREGGIVILSGLLVLAAAGGFNPATKSWFPKVSGWLLALVLYKPFAALTYATAFFLIGDEDGDPRSLFVGLTMLVLSIVALPAMIKFFSWAAPAAVNAGSGGGGLAALGGAALAAAALRQPAGGGSASDHASQLRSDLGPAATPQGAAGNGSVPMAHTQGATPAPTTGGGAAATGAGAGGAAAGAAGGGAAAAAGPAGAALLVADKVQEVAKVAKNKASDGMTGGAG